MAQSAPYLLIGSMEAFSGKSATIVGLVHQLQQQGIKVTYGKPLGTFVSQSEVEEADVKFMQEILNFSEKQALSPLLNLDSDTISQRLQGTNVTDYTQILREYVQQTEGDLMLLEGAGTIWEGALFNLSTSEIANLIDASILLVARYHSPLIVDSLLTAKSFLGDRLLGVLLNDIPEAEFEQAQNQVKPFLEQQQIPVLGLLPSDRLLRSISVRELAQQLNAEVLCRQDRLDLMVESLTIGAMNVNSALEYFRQRQNMAVVTGGDRTDLQLAALETSTQCLILTGHIAPQPIILSRAEYLEIPILSVDLDTLTTVEIIDRAFGRVRIQEPIKIQCIQELMAKYFDIERLKEKLGLT